MKKTLQHLTILGLLIFMSCASNVKSKTFTNEDFSNFETFAYLPSTAFKAEEFNDKVNGSIEESLITTMNTKMVEKGFSINKNNPDLLVILTTSNEIESNLKDRRTYDQASSSSTNSSSPNYATVSSTDYSRYFSNTDAEISNRPYKTGTLVVKVFSSKSKELLWQGIAEDFKAHISDQTLMTRMINEIFEKFPS